MRKTFILILNLVLFFGCANKNNEHITVVGNIDYKGLSGTWYIVGLYKNGECNNDEITIDYAIEKDGFSYLKRQISRAKQDKKEAKALVEKGKIRILKDRSGALEISRFGLFYDSYNIVNLDVNYKSALIVGDGDFWIIDRKPQMPFLMREIYTKYLLKHGFKQDQICWKNDEKR